MPRTGDIFNTPDTTLKDPLAGIWFRIEKGPPVGPGIHGYDEAGVVWEGMGLLLPTDFVMLRLLSKGQVR